jgi:hypothetical protein
MSIQFYPLHPCLANMVKKMTVIPKWIQYVIVWIGATLPNYLVLL